MENATQTATSPSSATAEWWADKVFGAATGSSGDGMADVMSVVAGAQGRSPDASQRDRFVDALTAHIESELERLANSQYGTSVTLSTDYGPEGILASLSDQIGLRGSFPWKTITWTHPTHVVVALGYGAPGSLAWQAPDWERPVCGHGKYGPESREPWSCSSPVYHEGDHVFDIPDPLCQHVYTDGFRAGERCLRPRRDGDVHDPTDAWSATHEFVELSLPTGGGQ